MAQVMKDIVTWLKQWFYTESEVDTITGGLQTQINNKADTTTVTALTNTVNGKLDSSDYVVDSALSSSSTNPLQNKAINTALNGKANSTHTHTKSQITDFAHTHSATDVTDANAHSHIGTSANATQSAINTALDTAIGNLISADLIVVVTTLPTASINTMNKIYCVTDRAESQNLCTEYLTIYDEANDQYMWEKIGVIDSGVIVVNWADINNKPSTFPPSAHTHDDIYYTETEVDGLLDDKLDSADYVVDSALSSSSTNPVQNNVINTALSGKAPTSHSSSATTYGVGSTSNYGHCKTVNGLTTSSHSDGLALGAYQGYVLNQNKSAKTETIDISNITLVDKGETNEGCIIFNTIS